MVTCRLSVPMYLAGYATSILVTVVTSTLWSVTAMEASTGTTGSTAAMLRPLRSSLSVGSSIKRNQPCPSSLPSLLLSPSSFHFLHPSVSSLSRWSVDLDGRLLYWCYTDVTSPQHVFLPTTRGKKDILTAGTKRRKRPVWWQLDVVWWEARSVALLSSWLDHHDHSRCSFHGQLLYDIWWIKNMSIKSKESKKLNNWYQLTVACGSFLALSEH